jgi:rod shape-determining protein MreD
MLEYLKYAGILLVLIILQKTLIGFIDVTSYKITPDIVMVGLVYVGINRGKVTGSVSGFLSGLVLDLFSFSFIGLMALSKCAAGFISGYFNNENKLERYLGSYIFILIVFLCSLINNIIYYTIYFQGSNLTYSDILLRYVIPTAIYTAIFSLFPIIFAKRRKSRR